MVWGGEGGEGREDGRPKLALSGCGEPGQEKGFGCDLRRVEISGVGVGEWCTLGEE